MYITCLVMLFASVSGILLLPGNNAAGAAVASFGTGNISRAEALTALMEAEDTIKAAEALNHSSYFFRDMLLDAKRAFIGERVDYLQADIIRETGFKREYLESLLKVAKQTPAFEVKKLNYSEVVRLADVIKLRMQQAYGILDTIAVLEERETSLKASGAGTAEALSLIRQAKSAFASERYDGAEKYLAEADAYMDNAGSESARLKGLVVLSRGFFEKYWLRIIIALAIIAAAAVPSVWLARKRLAKRKLESLKTELESIGNSIKKAQEDCFRDKKITEATYRLRVEKYWARMAEIKHTIPVLESLTSGRKKHARKAQAGILEVRK